MKPTPRLRFVERNEPVILNGEEFDNWQKVLQQWWEWSDIEAYDKQPYGTNFGEWRDVPVEKEA